MSTTAGKKIIAARTSMVLDEPFFGALALSLPPKEDTTCETAWTDGRNIGYNPTFIESLTHAEIVGLFKHETLHCAMGHPWRRDGREHRRFNVACDLAINPDCGTLPKGSLVPNASQLGKSAEWIYARLPESPKGKGGKGTPDPAGEVRDAPTGADEDGQPAPTEGEWKQRTAEALQQAKMQGALPEGLARMVESALDKRVDVKSLLLRFFTERTRSDYDFCRPNTRYISLGLYLPALHSVSMGEVAILCDTSSSVSGPALQFARGILEQVLDEVQPAGVTLYFVDTKIHGTHRMEPGDPLAWEPKGGGGTCFKSCFSEFEKSDIMPVCIVAISDLDASFPDSCSIPTLWITDNPRKTAPFGETIFVDR